MSGIFNIFSIEHCRKVAMSVGSGKSRLSADLIDQIDQQFNSSEPQVVKTNSSNAEDRLPAAVRKATQKQS